MKSGIIQFYNDIHGNGYIVPDDESERINFSYRSIKIDGFKILHEGQHVEYQIKKTKKGPVAINIEPV